MLKFRKIQAIVCVAAIFCTATAGCSTTKIASGTSSAESGAAVQSEDYPTITWYAAGCTPDGVDRIDTAANKILSDAGIKAKLNLVWLGWNNYSSQISTMLASNESFDIFNGDMASIDGYALNGGVRDIKDDNLTTYLPDVVKAMGNTIVNNCRYNGALYAIPVAHEYAQNFGIIYNSDLATKYNLDMSKVKSVSDLDSLFAQLHAANPKIICAFSGTDEALRPMADIDYINNSSSLCAGMYLNNDCKEAFNYFQSDKVVAALKKIREWYQDGYLETDTTADQASMLNKGGTIFCVIERFKPGSAEQQSQDFKFKSIAFSSSAKSTFCDFPAGWGNAISSTSKNPELAMQVLNMAYKNADFINLLTFGEKDVDYTLSSDNILTLKNSGYGYDAYGSASWQMGNHYLNYITKSQQDAGLSDIWTQLKDFNTNAQVLDHTGFYFDSTKYTTQISAIANVYKEYSTMLYDGSVDVDSTLSEFNKALDDNGMQTVLDAINAQYKTFLASKSK